MKTHVPKPFWLIVKDEAGRMEVLTSRFVSGEEALPVFSFEEEARMFLELGALSDDWRVRVTSAGELISLLFGLCANVQRVALDPLPGPDGAALNDLVSMEREAFMEFAGEQGYGGASIAWGNRIGQKPQIARVPGIEESEGRASERGHLFRELSRI
jgi:hypothetical protein